MTSCLNGSGGSHPSKESDEIYNRYAQHSSHSIQKKKEKKIIDCTVCKKEKKKNRKFLPINTTTVLGGRDGVCKGEEEEIGFGLKKGEGSETLKPRHC